MGFRTEQFEQKWCTYTDTSFAHYLNSSSSGLNLAVSILGRLNNWNSSTQIITTPLTFISTNHAILHSGFQPVFADCDDTGNLTVKSIEECITPNTRCVMFVGLGGNFGELPSIFKLCQKHNLKLIVDAAHMAGSTSQGMHANKFGDITIYSFQAVKNLPTADSGILCTEDPVIDKIARKLSWLGIDKDTYQRAKEGNYKWDYDVTELGHKYHGNSIVASIALAQLPHLDTDNRARRKVAAWYKQYLDSPQVQIIEHLNADSSSYHLFQVRVPNRAKLMDRLSSRGISTGVHYKDNTLYPMYRPCVSHAKNARSFWETLLTLPCHLNINESDVKRISCSINEFY